jgi:hypothetical protein
VLNNEAKQLVTFRCPPSSGRLVLPKAQAPQPDNNVHKGPQPPRCNIALSERAAEFIGSESGRRW